MHYRRRDGNGNTMAMLMQMQFCDGGCHHQLCGALAAVDGGGSDGGHLCRRLQTLLTEAMAVFVDGDNKGGLRRGRTWSRMDKGKRVKASPKHDTVPWQKQGQGQWQR